MSDTNDPADTTSGAPSLWTGDRGTLREATRRVLLELLKGPYVSGAQNPGLWAALVADEDVVRSRLHDVFLELSIDRVEEFAFTRRVDTDELSVPAALRSERLTFLDTAMVLVLRQLLLEAPGERRVIVDREEVYERLTIYRTGDESSFLRHLNGSWTRMRDRLRVLHKAGEGRYEISPMVRFLVDEDRVRELVEVYARIAGGRTPGPLDPLEPRGSADAADDVDGADPGDASADDTDDLDDAVDTDHADHADETHDDETENETEDAR